MKECEVNRDNFCARFITLKKCTFNNIVTRGYELWYFGMQGGKIFSI